MVRALDRQTQRSHVLQRLVKETVEFFVACFDLDHGLEPFRHRREKAGLVSFPDTIARRMKLLLAILERIQQTGMPSLARLKRDLEAEPSIGGNGLARCTRYCDRQRAVKITVRIRGTKPLPALRPFGGDLAAAYDLARLHLEDVGKVASQRDFELKAHWLQGVVGDIEIFVHAADDRSADREADGAWRDRTVFGENGFIGEEDACCVIVDRTAVQQLPRFAVGVNRPVAHYPRVEKVKALLARPVDLPVMLADEHRLALVDGNLGGADLNLECHGVVLIALLVGGLLSSGWHQPWQVSADVRAAMRPARSAIHDSAESSCRRSSQPRNRRVHWQSTIRVAPPGRDHRRSRA